MPKITESPDMFQLQSHKAIMDEDRIPITASIDHCTVALAKQKYMKRNKISKEDANSATYEEQ